jgi:MFS family permease
MNGFSASEAALEGFRLTRERPGTIAAWSVINFVGVTTIGGLMLASLGAPLIDYIKKGGLNSIHPEELAGVLTASWPAFFGIMAVVILFLSIMTAGIFRIVLRPGEKGFAHLRLGKDELRLSAVNLMLLPMGLVFLAIIDLVGAQVASRSGNLAGLVAAALVAAPMIWIGVRLSLATPMTFAEHRISLKDSWGLTRGRFWPLFGMILLAVIFYIIIWALILIIYAALTQLGGGPDNMLGAKGVGVSPMAIVILLLTLALQMILPVLQSVMIYAPFAVAYQQLHGDQPANPLRARMEHG